VQDFKISLITVSYNAGSTISRCIESVIAQNFKNFEYIIIDGGSTDGTIKIINQYKNHVNIFISEKDGGIYDAMNKGISRASGTIIGTLNADDFFAADDVLGAVAAAFAQQNPDMLYGDLDYVAQDETIVRKWRTKAYVQGMYNWGWMPPHPTFYCKKQLFERFGLYNVEYGTAADYELMLRFMQQTNVKALHVNKVMVKMQSGGVSNNSLPNRVKAWKGDLRAMQQNGVLFPLVVIFLKPLRKVTQFF
jgi:glycosyltransferase involved in cell wall biosynthesis